MAAAKSPTAQSQQPVAAERDSSRSSSAHAGQPARAPEERERLFQEFLKWSQARERR